MNGAAPLEQHAGISRQREPSEETVSPLRERFGDLDGIGSARKDEDSTAHGRATIVRRSDRVLEYAPRMDEIPNDTRAGSRFKLEATFSFAALLSAIPAVLVKVGLDRMIEGMTGNGALPSAHGGATLFAVGIFLLAFPILLAVFGVRDEIITRLQARSDGSTRT